MLSLVQILDPVAYVVVVKIKNTTTTTTDAERARFDVDNRREALTWPSAFDDNMRRLLHHTLSVSVDTAHHQDILDAMAHKARDRDDPPAQPGGVRDRTVQPDQERHLPTRRSTAGDAEDTAQHPPTTDGQTPPWSAASCSARSQGLKQLRRASGQGAPGERLERQIADLQTRLSELGGERR